MKKCHDKPARGSAKEAKKIQLIKKATVDNWMFHATQEEIDNCICCEWDGKGVSCCGVPCPVHSKNE